MFAHLGALPFKSHNVPVKLPSRAVSTESLVGRTWKDLIKEGELPPFKKEDFITVNVSGWKYVLRQSLLHNHPSTLLGGHFKDAYFDKRKQEYFLDRDPFLFRYIAGFFQTGHLHCPEDDCLDSFIDEMLFYKIPLDSLCDDCSEDVDDLMEKQRIKKEILLEQKEKRKSAGLESAVNTTSFRKSMWSFLEDPNSGSYARLFYFFSALIIILSVSVNVFETIPCDELADVFCGESREDFYFYTDTGCIAFFTAEYCLRLYSTPHRFAHLTELMSVIDILAILPYYVDLFMSMITTATIQVDALVTLRVLRIFRVFKLVRHSKRLQQLSKSVKDSANELGFLLFVYFMVVIIASTLIYYSETSPTSVFQDIPDGMWYCVVTTTTLGYGDIVPDTALGKIFGGLCCLMGVLIIALPVPVLQMKTSMDGEVDENGDGEDEGTGSLEGSNAQLRPTSDVSR